MSGRYKDSEEFTEMQKTQELSIEAISYERPSEFRGEREAGISETEDVHTDGDYERRRTVFTPVGGGWVRMF